MVGGLTAADSFEPIGRLRRLMPMLERRIDHIGTRIRMARGTDVELEFTVEALEAIATKAIKRATGARGLRAILEEALLGVMYDLPGRDDVAKVIVDADTGYGNALNVQRTVRTFERAGAAAVQLEDQAFPKRCGHLDGKILIPAGEMQGKIAAACDARTKRPSRFSKYSVRSIVRPRKRSASPSLSKSAKMAEEDQPSTSRPRTTGTTTRCASCRC